MQVGIHSGGKKSHLRELGKEFKKLSERIFKSENLDQESKNRNLKELRSDYERRKSESKQNLY